MSSVDGVVAPSPEPGVSPPESDAPSLEFELPLEDGDADEAASEEGDADAASSLDSFIAPQPVAPKMSNPAAAAVESIRAVRLIEDMIAFLQVRL
ncbi:hypothetical protein [Dermabacter hominis]|uniref:hypothetical protein n=1 Tax=Dermabacter hominis TaxID=36740 RepID=UPI0021A77DD1|nr:hypothetical protein [Dermabacter hominis]MCT1955129.1 hypothetical protein [Dermabacter hominis]